MNLFVVLMSFGLFAFIAIILVLIVWGHIIGPMSDGEDDYIE